LSFTYARRGRSKSSRQDRSRSSARHHVAPGSRARQRVRSFDLCADGGIDGLKRRFRPGGGASPDANEREHEEQTANHSPVVGHRPSATLRAKRGRLCNHFGEDQADFASLRITSLQLSPGPRRAHRRSRKRIVSLNLPGFSFAIVGRHAHACCSSARAMQGGDS